MAATKDWEAYSYQIKSTYLIDHVKATEEDGKWSFNQSQYQITAVVSDDSTFDFQVFFENEKIFVLSGEQWHQNDIDSRFVEELTPLDQSFEWVRQLLDEADQVERVNNGEQLIYTVHFEELNDFDFRGTMLQQQEQSTLTIKVVNEQINSIVFEVEPIKPETIGMFDRYPSHLQYTMEFEQVDSITYELPEEAYESEHME